MISRARRHSSARAGERADRVERPRDRDDAVGRARGPSVGRWPVTPQNAAGIRTEPAVSVPSATSTSPAATAAPLPPLEPPVDPLGIPRVPRRAEVRAVRERAEGELVRVQLPDDRRAGRPQPRDALGVAVGHAVEDLRRRRRRHARDVDHVLDARRASRPPPSTRCRKALYGSSVTAPSPAAAEPSISSSAGRIRVEEVEDAFEILVGRMNALLQRRFPGARKGG